MAKELTFTEETKLIEIIDGIDEALDVGNGKAGLNTHMRGATAATKLIARLVADKVAALGCSYGTSTLRMGGVKASCTAGSYGLLRNWQAAARKRINEKYRERADMNASEARA